MAQRCTYRRRLSYNTKQNRVRKVKTPGGRLVFQYVKKTTSGASCGVTGVKLQGVKTVRKETKKQHKTNLKSVSRAYGGTLSAQAVRDRIVRAFLIEEQKIVKKVIKAQGQK